MRFGAEHLTIHVDTGRWSETVVSDASLTVESGELVVMLGESGSGKSMLAMAVADRLPDAATITSGHLVNEVDRAVAYVPQDGVTAFDPVRPVGVQLRESAGSQEVLFEQACEAADYPLSLAELLPGEHSAGQIQRAAIASAYLSGISTMVVDEPTASLDANSARRVWTSLRDRARSGAAVLVISHDLAAVVNPAVTDRLVLVRDGRSALTGTVEELRTSGDPFLREIFRMAGAK